ncbi:MAG: flagellar filament capping protein FliD [gamma proteobacterium endosymbiont of Lamellibrachia anaximandri]|nr:flagellar filament capping protein FliD [gamma proteobacterium endosymbiont of Lamellibrachia anaximandri]MBL3616663.1 flagellar filament capping protein FliD [gamma proteobacterium endosymbiont of Lamellibrachia anaximandri]
MPTISAPGIGSGLDVNSIVDQLMSLEQIPIQNLQSKEAGFLTQISAYGALRGSLASFQSTVDKLNGFSGIGLFSASSADEAVFTVNADNDAAAGSYDIVVQTLAESHKMGSASFADSDTTTIGNAGDTMTLAIGTQSFNVDIGGKTLSQIEQAINEATDNTGISAGIIQENSGSFYLTLTSDETGVENAMSVSFADSGDNPIADPLTMVQTRAAADAQLLVDNSYTITRSSNSISDAIQGVTLELLATSVDEVALNVDKDLGAVQTTVQSFVDAYNSLRDTLSTLGSGELSGDGTLRMMEQQISSVLGSKSDVDGAFKYASSIGISFQRDGSLKLDTAVLTEALESDFSSVTKLFSDDDQGLAFRLDVLVENMLDPDGLIDAREDGLDARVKNVQDQRESLEFRLAKTEARFRAQFAGLDTLMVRLSATSDFLTQQLQGLQDLASYRNNN